VKISAYCGLHYGREWLEWAIRSTLPFVDSWHIFYAAHPSHGHDTRSTCPDTKEMLQDIAIPMGVQWHDIPDTIRYEGQHRDYATEWLKSAGADRILWVDADEVWSPDDLEHLYEQAMAGLGKREYRVKVHGHLWKSVNWICRDACMPVRMIDPHAPMGTEHYVSNAGFWHFGYAQAFETVAYKIKIHGHRGEFRRNWLSIYSHWKPGDIYKCGVHPTNGCDDKTGKSFWTPEAFDRFEIADLIGDHPYFCDELI
jgi:hypothetical protein